MEKDAQCSIYKGIIQYILNTTFYTIKDIAILTNASIKNINAIYSANDIPSDLKSELALLQLYQFILEVNANKLK